MADQVIVAEKKVAQAKAQGTKAEVEVALDELKEALGIKKK